MGKASHQLDASDWSKSNCLGKRHAELYQPGRLAPQKPATKSRRTPPTLVVDNQYDVMYTDHQLPGIRRA
jgi:hypothetical protein